MNTIKPLITILALAALFTDGVLLGHEPQNTPPLSNKTANDPVVETTLVWLGDIDDGNYAQSWNHASAGFKNAVSNADWQKALKSIRTPLGALVNRQLQHRQRTAELPGAPKGDYVVMQFATEFARKKSAIETVTFVRESDGVWRAIGYFIK